MPDNTIEVFAEQSIKESQPSKLNALDLMKEQSSLKDISSINSSSSSFGSYSLPDLRITAGNSVSPEVKLTQALTAADLGARSNYIFGKFDNDKDGFLSKKELAGAIQDPNTKGEDAQLAAGLYHGADKMQGLSNDEYGIDNDGISRKDLDVFDKTQQDEKLGNYVNHYMNRVFNSQLKSNDRLYASSNALDSIKPDAVAQGSIGNCYFEAALASTAAANPAAIRDMIKANADGTFTVTFPGDVSHPITVNAPTESERGLYNRGSERGIWAGVMEKAFGEYKQQQGWWREGFTSQEGGDGGGWSSEAFKLLTNKAASETNPGSSLEDTKKSLSAAFQDGKAVTCASSQRGYEKLLGWDTTKDSFPRGHEYSVISFDPNGADGGTVTLRNPWGLGAGVTGEKAISLKDFTDNFNLMTVSDK